jgi:uncharacterized protein (TIGR02391 family)
MVIQKLDLATLEQIARAIGDMFTGSQIVALLREAGIENKSPNSTKWRILNDCFIAQQNKDNCANNVLNLIKIAFNPRRHLNNSNYDNMRTELNKHLSFEGIEITDKGEIGQVSKSTTISEAQKRADNLKNRLRARNAHNDIFVYCGTEIEAENYFHVVFEATKGIFDKIRKKTGLVSDGARLVDEAFSFDTTSPIPYLALNELDTETKQSEQKGFMNLLKGVYGTFRNPCGHEVKIAWEIKEADALDTLSLISLIYR